ncbi:MAG: DEAD/DEAH box helicase, partial [Catenulispora sp.]|nr:DEAD/DEAH box helicase [Catenulispora sp.]
GGRKPSGAPAPTGAPGRPLGLVVVPTRELAVQVTEDLSAAGKVMAARVQSVYGGRAYEPQIAALSAGVDVVVGTPGRLLDLAKQGHLDLSGVRMLVLDEADEMLDLGFLPDVERIVKHVPNDRQTLLFSATMPGQVIALARQYMTKPTHIRAADPHDSGTTVANITQRVYRAHALDKTEMLARMLQAEGRGLTMVFCRTKRTAAKVAEELDDRGYAAAAVHGDLGQGAREQALRAFRNGKVDVLVATDVAARGIDVEGVTHVVNFQCPEDDKTYLHRIGRTARAGASGTAVTFVDWDEVPRWNLINKTLGLDFHEPRETYSTSEWFFEELNIPADSKGRLLKSQQTRAGLAAEEVEDLGETGRGAGVRARGPRSDRSERSERSDRSERAERPTRAKRDRVRTRGGQRLGEGDVAGSELTEAPTQTADAGERPKRTRTRTRGGAGTVEGSIVESAVAASAETVADDVEAKPKRTRSRTRGGASTVESSIVESAVAASAETVADDVETKPKRTRSRTRGGANAAELVETAAVEVAEQAAPAAEVADEPKRTRGRSKAAAAEVEAVLVDTDTVVEAEKPKRSRSKAVTEAVAETAVVEAQAPADKPKRTRARKVAAPAEAPAIEVVEGADKPKRTRRTTAETTGLTSTGVAATGNYNS